jgi:tagatose 6-phosphate kinase
MILCVTLNPCLDKTLIVPCWHHGDSVRGISLSEVVGGKGNNVARALKRLGRGPIRPATFLGGAVGRRCEELLIRNDEMDPLIVPIDSSTREILTVRTKDAPEQTAFFDPDPSVSADDAHALVQAVGEVLKSGQVQAMTMSGSSPAPATHGVFSDLIAVALTYKIPTFLDTYGPSLDAIWGFWPNVMQVNLREATMHLGLPKGRPSDTDIGGLLDRWWRRGVKVAVVTDGPNRFLAKVDGKTYRVRPPAIEPVNPIGSGDCFLAGLVDGFLGAFEPTELLRHAVGCAVANALVWDAGAIEMEAVRQIAAEVVVEEVGG